MFKLPSVVSTIRPMHLSTEITDKYSLFTSKNSPINITMEFHKLTQMPMSHEKMLLYCKNRNKLKGFPQRAVYRFFFLTNSLHTDLFLHEKCCSVIYFFFFYRIDFLAQFFLENETKNITKKTKEQHFSCPNKSIYAKN